MKRLLLTMGLISMILFIQAQNEFSGYVITAEQDTISPVRILYNSPRSSFEKISFLTEGEEIFELSAEQVQEYYDGRRVFRSYETNPGKVPALIYFELVGPMWFGYGLDKKGKQNYFVKKDDDCCPVNLESHRSKLDYFLNQYFPQFVSFRKQYATRIYYDHKSLGELVSAYNAFRAPETYVFNTFEYDESTRLGLSINGIGSQFNFRSFSSDPLNAFGYQLGFYIEKPYTRKISYLVQPYFQQHFFQSANESLNMPSIGAEASLIYKFYINHYFKFHLGLGINPDFNFKSELIQEVLIIGQKKRVQMKVANLGWLINSGLNYNNQFIVLLNFYQYPVQTESFFITGNFTPARALISGAKLGLVYLF